MRINRKQIRFSIFILGLLVMAVLFVALMQAKFSNVFASSEDASKEDSYITIYDSGNELVVKSSATTVREVLERAEIKIENEDIVELHNGIELSATRRMEWGKSVTIEVIYKYSIIGQLFCCILMLCSIELCLYK